MLIRFLTIIVVISFCATAFAQDAALETEAARFAKEADFFYDIGKFEEALEKIEVAVALDPENLDHRKKLWDMLTTYTSSHILKSSYRTSYGVLVDFGPLCKYDEALRVYRPDAETMRWLVDNALRLESLANTFPPGRSIYDDKRYTIFNYITNELARLASLCYSEYKNELRSLNRRLLDDWMEKRYRVSLSRVRDQESFRQHFREQYSSLLSEKDELDLVVVYEEMIEDTLRLLHQYEYTSKGNIPPMLYDLFQSFAELTRKCRRKNISGTNPEAAAILERTLLLMEQDSLWTPKIYAWIARNKPVDSDSYANVATYFQNIKSYLAGLPTGIPDYDSSILYFELWITRGTINNNFRKEQPLYYLLSTEIMELADSRNEIASYAMNDYLSDHSFFAEKITPEKMEQLDAIVRRQVVLAKLGDNEFAGKSLREAAANAGIIVSESTVIERPWKTEINLFAGEEFEKAYPSGIGLYPFVDGTSDRAMIRNNTFYCVVLNRKSRDLYLACVDLKSLTKRYISIDDKIDASSPHRIFFHYVDDVNAYFLKPVTQMDNPQGRETKLSIHPLDGSESWSLTLQDGLPSENMRVLGTLDGWCYAKIDNDWVIRIDLKTRKWEMLSSSRATTGKTPFVNGRQLKACFPLDDPVRERIIFMEVNEYNKYFWAIDKDDKFNLIDTYLRGPTYGLPTHDTRDLPCNGNQLLFGDDMLGNFVFDCETDTVFPVHVRGTGCFWNDYVWGTITTYSSESRWGRFQGDTTSEIEALPLPELLTPPPNPEQARWERNPIFCIPTPDGKNLVVVWKRDVTFLHFE